jgi:hypothetical protein
LVISYVCKLPISDLHKRKRRESRRAAKTQRPD